VEPSRKEDEEEAGIFVLDARHFKRCELLGSGGFADVHRFVRVRRGSAEQIAMRGSVLPLHDVVFLSSLVSGTVRCHVQVRYACRHVT